MSQLRKRLTRAALPGNGALGLLFALPGVAFAQAGGYFTNGYVGVSGGWTNSDDATGDDSDAGWKLFAGADVSQIFGVEVFYSDLGTFGYPGGNVDVTGFGVDLIGGLPITPQAGVFAKVGTIYATTDSGPSDESGFDWKYGVGARYNMTPNFAVRAEWEQHKIDNDMLKDDISMISLGVAYRFQPR